MDPEDRQRRKLYAEMQEILELHEAAKCGRQRLTDCKCKGLYFSKKRAYEKFEGGYAEGNRFVGRRSGRS